MTKPKKEIEALHSRARETIVSYVAPEIRFIYLAAPNLQDALKKILPLAEAYLKGAPSHPDQEKLIAARIALADSEGRG